MPCDGVKVGVLGGRVVGQPVERMERVADFQAKPACGKAPDDSLLGVR
jgi:hypothetical protein